MMEKFQIILCLRSELLSIKHILIAYQDNFTNAYRNMHSILSGREALSLPPDMPLPTGIVDATLTLEAAHENGEESPLITFSKRLQSNNINKKNKWLKPVYDELPREIVFRPDFAGVCIIDEEGAMGDALDFFLDYIPWDIEACAIAKEINDWQRIYELGVNIDRKKNVNFDWEGFHAKGMALFNTLQQHLGHRTKIVYLKVTELEPPDYEGCEVTFSQSNTLN